jgi:hypothetical protein
MMIHLLICSLPALWLHAGKSTFGCFLLYRLHQDYPAATILYVDHKRQEESKAILLPGTGAGAAAAVQQGSMFPAALADQNGFAVFDQGSRSTAPANLNAKAIVLSSLDNRHFKDFRGVYPIYGVMPSWDKGECLEAHTLLFAADGLAPAPILIDWEERFDAMGGVPRWVFDRTGTAAEVVGRFDAEFPAAEHIRTLLETRSAGAISAEKASRLVTYEVDEQGDPSQHPPVLPTFRERAWRWVSDRVGAKAMQTISDRDQAQAAQLLFGISGGDERSSFGAAFESWAHLQLAKGGTFRARPVGGGADTVLQLEAGETVWYKPGQEKDVADKV